jgi:hypothetical protein
MLDELRRDREENIRRWKEQRAKAEARKAEENKKWKEQNRGWGSQPKGNTRDLRRNPSPGQTSYITAEMYIFESKMNFYENQHGQRAWRKIVISPMVDESARAGAKKFGIEVYTHAEDVIS